MDRLEPVMPLEHIESVAHLKWLPWGLKGIRKNGSMKTFGQYAFRLCDVLKNTEEVFSWIYKMNVPKLCDSFPVYSCYCLMMRNDRYAEFFW